MRRVCPDAAVNITEESATRTCEVGMAAALARVAQLAQDEPDAEGHLAELQTLAFIVNQITVFVVIGNT